MGRHFPIAAITAGTQAQPLKSIRRTYRDLTIPWRNTIFGFISHLRMGRCNGAPCRYSIFRLFSLIARSMAAMAPRPSSCQLHGTRALQPGPGTGPDTARDGETFGTKCPLTPRKCRTTPTNSMCTASHRRPAAQHTAPGDGLIALGGTSAFVPTTPPMYRCPRPRSVAPVAARRTKTASRCWREFCIALHGESRLLIKLDSSRRRRHRGAAVLLAYCLS